MNYDYRIDIRPWYPSYWVSRREANTDGAWETVTNGASDPDTVKKLVIKEIEKMFESKE